MLLSVPFECHGIIPTSHQPPLLRKHQPRLLGHPRSTPTPLKLNLRSILPRSLPLQYPHTKTLIECTKRKKKVGDGVGMTMGLECCDHDVWFSPFFLSFICLLKRIDIIMHILSLLSLFCLCTHFCFFPSDCNAVPSLFLIVLWIF